MGGIETDIIAIRQEDNITIIQTPSTDIRISKSIDDITIRDIEDVLAGSSPLPVEIVIRKQEDSIVITRAPQIDITIKD